MSELTPLPDTSQKIICATEGSFKTEQTQVDWNLSKDPDTDDHQLEQLAAVSVPLTHLHVCMTRVTASGLLNSFFNSSERSAKLATLEGFCAKDFPFSAELHQFCHNLSQVSHGIKDLSLNGKERNRTRTDSDIVALIQSNPGLNRLTLEEFYVTAECLKALSQSAITELKLINCTIAANAEMHFGQSPFKSVCLGGCQGLSSVTFQALSSCPKLEQLFIGNSFVPSDLLKTLQPTPNLNLICLISCTGLTSGACLELASFPKLKQAQLDSDIFAHAQGKNDYRNLRVLVRGRIRISLLPDFDEEIKRPSDNLKISRKPKRFKSHIIP